MSETLRVIQHPGLLEGRSDRSLAEQARIAARGNKAAAGLSGPYFGISSIAASGAELLIPNGRAGGSERALATQLESARYPEMAGIEIVSQGPWVGDADLTPILDKHHPGWKQDLLKIARGGNDMAIEDDAVYTSMESLNGEGHITRYQVTDMFELRDRAPWLVDLFQNEIRYLTALWAGDPTIILGEDSSAININRADGGDYGGHVDRNWLTANFSLAQAKKGGFLELWEGRNEVKDSRTSETRYIQQGDSYQVLLKPGHVYFFNGFLHPHKVNSLSGERVVIPGNYHTERRPETRDKNFNASLGLRHTNGTSTERRTPQGLIEGRHGDLAELRARHGEREIINLTSSRRRLSSAA